jgi:hypothetical protein
LKAKGKGVFIAEVINVFDIKEPEFILIVKDIIEVAFEAKYKG